MKKKLMIIGANWEKVPLIQKAKKLGHFVFVTDESKFAEGFKYADKYQVINPRDLKKLLDVAKKYKPNGITADQCDYSHFAAVYIAKNLGLSNDGLTGAQLTTNKLWMREACLKDHILQPRFSSAKNFQDVEIACELIGLPIILKPTDNRGSIGVNIVRRKKQLRKSFLDTMANSHSRHVIVEAFIEGTHITVDGAFDQKGYHHNLAVACKKNMKGAKPVITDVLYPADLNKNLEENIKKINLRVVNALHLRSGLTHAEYILDNKGRCFLVEMANRGGGVLTSSVIIKNYTGIDLSELIIKNALKEKFIFKTLNKKTKIILKFLKFKSGKVIKISGLNEIKIIKNMLFFKLLFEENHVLSQPKSGAERHGFTIIKYSNKVQLRETLNKIKSKLKLIYK